MKNVFLFFSLVLTLTNTPFLFANHFDSVPEEQKPVSASFLRDLEELGYCVIPQVLSTVETKQNKRMKF